MQQRHRGFLLVLCLLSSRGLSVATWYLQDSSHGNSEGGGSPSETWEKGEKGSGIVGQLWPRVVWTGTNTSLQMVESLHPGWNLNCYESHKSSLWAYECPSLLASKTMPPHPLPPWQGSEDCWSGFGAFTSCYALQQGFNVRYFCSQAHLPDLEASVYSGNDLKNV